MNEIPRELVALITVAGELVCAPCVKQEPVLLDDEKSTVVLSSDDWKNEVLDQRCIRCHKYAEEP